MDFEPFLTGRFWAFWTVSTIIWTVLGSITDCLPKDMKTTTPYPHHLHESPATYSLATNPQVSRPSAGVFRLTVLHEGEYLIAPISEGWKHVETYLPLITIDYHCLPALVCFSISYLVGPGFPAVPTGLPHLQARSLHCRPRGAPGLRGDQSGRGVR